MIKREGEESKNVCLGWPVSYCFTRPIFCNAESFMIKLLQLHKDASNASSSSSSSFQIYPNGGGGKRRERGDLCLNITLRKKKNLDIAHARERGRRGPIIKIWHPKIPSYSRTRLVGGRGGGPRSPTGLLAVFPEQAHVHIHALFH